MKKTIMPAVFALLLLTTTAYSQTDEGTYRKHSIGISAFILFNTFTEPSPHFYLLSYGYHVTEEDILEVEAITWTYASPLGIPFGEDFDNPALGYPGSIREFGIGLAYKRYLWEGLFAKLHATPFLRQYIDGDGETIDTGFQLFMTLRFGYSFNFLSERFYIEPSVACNYWPVSTNVPDDFAAMEETWPNYFLFEPGLNFGIKF